MPDFPQNPYPITGFLQGAAARVIVKGINMTAGGSEEVITEVDGSWIIDPANMDEGYSDGDVISISSGTWYTHVKIDLENHPSGIVQDLKKPVIITPREISRGASVKRGIKCGRKKQR